MKGWRHFNFAALPVSPWRNGGGETHEIFSWPAGKSEENLLMAAQQNHSLLLCASITDGVRRNVAPKWSRRRTELIHPTNKKPHMGRKT